MAQIEPTTGYVGSIYEPSNRAETAAMLAKPIERQLHISPMFGLVDWIYGRKTGE